MSDLMCPTRISFKSYTYCRLYPQKTKNINVYVIYSKNSIILIYLFSNACITLNKTMHSIVFIPQSEIKSLKSPMQKGGVRA